MACVILKFKKNLHLYYKKNIIYNTYYILKTNIINALSVKIPPFSSMLKRIPLLATLLIFAVHAGIGVNIQSNTTAIGTLTS